MTKRQRQLLEFIKNYIVAKRGISPSFQEMADAMGTVKSAIFRRLNALEDQGYIRRLRYRNRAIEVIDDPHLPVQPLNSITNKALLREVKRRGFVPAFRLSGTIVEIPVGEE